MLMKKPIHRIVRGAALLVATVLLPACKSVDVPKVPGITPYRMVIQQGNFISQEMVGQLKPGMTKEQVRFVLGTPLVTDVFHADRWDYVFYREMPDGKREQRNLSVVFDNDKLARIIGDLLPAPGTAPQAGGFQPQQRNDTAPRPIGGAKPKPAADTATTEKPVADAPKSSAESPAPKEEEKPAAKAEDKPEVTAEQKTAEDQPKEKGFFGRMLEKIGL
jgi:outer membrane protein assembly factor BamE